MKPFDRQQIKAALRRKGLKNKDFGVALGLSEDQTSKYFSGVRQLNHTETLLAHDFLSRHNILPQPGFAESTLSPWRPRTPREHEVAAHIGEGARSPMHWTLDQSAPAFALLAGDVVVVDSTTEVEDGAIVAARRVEDETDDHAITFIARKVGPILVTGRIEADAPIYSLNTNKISLIGPVVGSFRRR